MPRGLPPKREPRDPRRERRTGPLRKGAIHPSGPKKPPPGQPVRGVPGYEAAPSAPTEIMRKGRLVTGKPPGAPASRPAAPAKSVPLTKEQTKVGKVLLAEGPITSGLVRREIEEAGMQNSLLAKAVAASGHASESELVTLLLTGYRIPKVKLANYRVPRDAVKSLPAHLARKHKLVPLGRIGSILCVAVGNIFEMGISVVEDIRRETGYFVKVFQSTPESVRSAVKILYPAPTKREVMLAVALGPDAKSSTTGGIPYEDTAEYWEKTYTTGGPVKVVRIED